MADSTYNQDSVAKTLDRCREAGVETYCVCAGSRNSPLVVALSRARGVRVYSFFEERSAAFFALGRMQVTDRPVAVVTTSGTAAAELLPAAVEAHYQGLPLVMITADRPAEFRGSGAPQVIEQTGLFGVYAELDAEKWNRRRPLHLNVELAEPLSPELSSELDLTPNDPEDRSPAEQVDLSDFLTRDTVALLGKLKRSQAEGVLRFLKDSPLPVLAEASSNLRGHPELNSREIRGSLRIGDLGRVLRLGGVPACRLWRDLEEHPEVPVCSVSEVPFSGLARESQFIVACPGNIAGKVEGESSIRLTRDPSALLDEFSRSEPALVRAVSNAVGNGSLIFLGNSMPVRDWDLAATRSLRDVHVIANRGANGIDGNVSSFLGASTDFEESWCVVGDLTAMYDLAAPWILPQLPEGARRRIVVINNGGGAIFHRVADLQGLRDEEMKLMTNAHEVRLDSWAAMWGMKYARWDGGVEFPVPGDDRDIVIEIFPDADQTERFWRSFQSVK